MKRNKKVSNETIRRYLKREKIYAYSSYKKPLLSKKNIEKRNELCKKWIYESEEYWHNVIFSDECKFNLYNSDGCSYVWRKVNKRLNYRYVEPTVKYGKGNIMVWACFSYKGLGNLVFIEDKMNAYSYLDILKNNLFKSAHSMGFNEFIYQHDNDPKHTSKLIKNFFINKNIPVLDWPSQSPDLNPIEHIWVHMKTQIRGKIFNNKEELKKDMARVWNNIPKELIVKLINSVPKRVMEVVKSKGGYIKY